MKKALLTVLISGGCLFASAQSLDLGFRGGAANTWLFNSNVFNAGSDQDVAISVSPVYGFHSAINFLGGTGIELEALYCTYTQNYKGSFVDAGGLYQSPAANFPTTVYQNNETYTSATKLTLIQIPLLFHYEAKGGFGLEVGPEYCIVSDASYSATYTGQPAGYPSSIAYGTKGSFNSSSLNAVLGFGWNVKLIPSGKLYLLTDLRFEWGLTDMKGTDALGQDMNNQATNPVYQGTNSRYSSYSATHMLEGSFSIGLFYRLNLVPGVHSFM